MLLEYGTNNKKLLDKEKEYQTKITTLEKDVEDHWKTHKGFLDDLKASAEENKGLQESIKQLSFRPADKIETGKTYSVLFAMDEFNMMLNSLDKHGGVGTLLIEYRDGTCRMVGCEE